MVWGKKHSPTPSVENALGKTLLKGKFTETIRTKNYNFMSTGPVAAVAVK